MTIEQKGQPINRKELRVLAAGLYKEFREWGLHIEPS
jgi:hypothetical protein